MKRIGSGLVLALAAFVVTAADVTAGTAGGAKLGPGLAQQASLPPTRVTDQPDALLLALKENDFAALLEAMENDKDIAQIAKRWDESAAERRAAAAKAGTTEAATTEPAALDAAEDEAEMVWRKLQTDEGVEQLIGQIHAEGAQWLYLLPDTFLGSLYGRVIPAALQLRLPSFGAAELAVRAGGALVGLVSRYHSVGQLAGAKALEILAGGKAPGQLPVETLRRFSLLVNMRVAHSLRMYPPIDMLNYAEVIAMGDAPRVGA